MTTINPGFWWNSPVWQSSYQTVIWKAWVQILTLSCNLQADLRPVTLLQPNLTRSVILTTYRVRKPMAGEQQDGWGQGHEGGGMCLWHHYVTSEYNPEMTTGSSKKASHNSGNPGNLIYHPGLLRGSAVAKCRKKDVIIVNTSGFAVLTLPSYHSLIGIDAVLTVENTHTNSPKTDPKVQHPLNNTLNVSSSWLSAMQT